MPVRMVFVRHMAVRMPDRFMPVQVTVHADHLGDVDVAMVPVVMAVSMFMLDRVVHVLVPMRLGQMQHDACDHEPCTGQHPDAAAALAQRERQCGTEKRGEREDRRGARGTERALREQIEAQAQSVPGGPDQQQAQRRARGRFLVPLRRRRNCCCCCC